MSTIDPLTRRHLAVRGHVQGVGFRWFARQTAETLGLSGWVRNREDGSVEAEAEGTSDALDKFERILRNGNPAARVDEIATQTRAITNQTSFKIL